ncbi:unnamed protein product [Heligmosomoides polygyrus]|uniref:Uncharacterized protein n=1 Tax=Heligmosomoides polygyrus TaxID=6339 RepID=A0A3P8C7L7_HELPZ|nr:unnamed protein product [Heligmosomoides polygyrus]
MHLFLAQLFPPTSSSFDKSESRSIVLQCRYCGCDDVKSLKQCLFCGSVAYCSDEHQVCKEFIVFLRLFYRLLTGNHCVGRMRIEIVAAIFCTSRMHGASRTKTRLSLSLIYYPSLLRRQVAGGCPPIINSVRRATKAGKILIPTKNNSTSSTIS